tara:strand:- start:15153 stop:15398 length:246 start_codon:yes stop_codon:yes gene_type:complete
MRNKDQLIWEAFQSNSTSKLNKEQTKELVNGCYKKFRELSRLYKQDFLDEAGDNVVEEFLYDLHASIELDLGIATRPGQRG